MTRSLHERLYELQPCFFLYNVPFKVAVSKNLRGLQLVKIPPGYVIRRLFYPSGTPGTRPQRAAK